MEITDIKEYASKTKFTLSYKGMKQKKCEIQNTCTPGYEKEFCKSVINNIISGMYINVGNLQEADAWLHGKKWDNEKIQKKRNNSSWCCDQIEELISEYKISVKETNNENVKRQLQITINDLENILYK